MRLARFDRERAGRLQSALAQSKPRKQARYQWRWPNSDSRQGRKGLFGLGRDLLISCYSNILHTLSLAQRSGAGD